MFLFCLCWVVFSVVGCPLVGFGWDPASSSEGLSEGVCLVILRVRGVSLGVVLGSGLVFGARPEHSRDSVQCLGLDSYLGFVCSRETNEGFYWASWVCSVLSKGVCLVVLHVGDVSLGVVLGSGLVFGARPEHSRDSVQCLGLDSCLGFVGSKVRFVRSKAWLGPGEELEWVWSCDHF